MPRWRLAAGRICSYSPLFQFSSQYMPKTEGADVILKRIPDNYYAEANGVWKPES